MQGTMMMTTATTPEKMIASAETASSTITTNIPPCPFSIHVEVLDRMLNFEIVDHPIYVGLELQGYGDEQHGQGLVVFLNRRVVVVDDDCDTHTHTHTTKTDVYYQPGLRLNPKLYGVGGGLGIWKEWTFATIRLDINEDDGAVDAELDFRDVDERHIQLRIVTTSTTKSQKKTKQHGGNKMAHGFLAPMGANIENPHSLPLVYMTQFDLLRRTSGDPDPVITIDGISVSPGRLPMERFLKRRLIKVAKDLCIVSVNPTADANDKKEVFRSLPKQSSPGTTIQADDGHHDSSSWDGKTTNIVSIGASSDNQKHTAFLRFEPPFPSLIPCCNDDVSMVVSTSLEDEENRNNTTTTTSLQTTGHWSIDIDDAENIVGGSWNIQPSIEEETNVDAENGKSINRNSSSTRFYDIGMDVTQGWHPPRGLPLLMKVVTTCVSVFRTWPTTYRWSATVLMRRRDSGEEEPDQEQYPESSRSHYDNQNSSGGSFTTMTSRWERTSQERGQSYSRIFGGRKK